MASTRVYYTQVTPTDNNTWTFSCWFKRGTLGGKQVLCSAYVDGANTTELSLTATGAIEYYDWQSSAYKGRLSTNRLCRDTGAWYHVVFVWDSDNGTPGDRMKLYINGVEETSFAADSNPSSGQATILNTSGKVCEIGSQNSSGYFSGEMSHVQFVDGLALAPTEFGEVDSTSGIWTIKTSAYATPGNNGFFLKMEDRTNLDLDSSSNAFTFTTGGTLTATYDNPNNNFATLNPIARNVADTGSLTNGNTTYTLSSYVYNCRSTLPMPAGKWYWEIKQGQIGTRVGVTTANSNNNADTDGSSFFWGDAGNGGIHILKSNNTANWVRTNNDTSQSLDTPTGNGIASATDDIIIMALDVDNQKLWVGVNGVWGNSGDPAGGTGEVMTMTNSSPDPYAAFIGFDATSSGDTAKLNFGNGYFGTDAVASANADDAGIGAFEYDVPTGFYALCTKNLKLQGG